MITAKDLQNFNLFTGLDEAELSIIANICTRRSYQINDIIFDPNTNTGDIYLLENGTDAIQIEISIPERENKLVIHTISKGETFGWASLGPPRLKTATARCLASVSVISINARRLMEVLDKNRNMGYLVMKNLSGIISTRLAYTTVTFRHEIQKLLKKRSEVSTPAA
jgi:CRP-like cAMP-binding protein